MTVHLYKITCLTNLHVGSGDVNYNIVDNEVERDPVTGDPTINSSGVKGALREHFTAVLDHEKVIDIFGQDNKERTDKNGKTIKPDPNKVMPGKYKFFNAGFLARPLRVSDGSSSFILVTTPEILCNFANLMRNLGNNDYDGLSDINVDKDVFISNSTGISIEGTPVSPIEGLSEEQIKLIKSLIGESFAITNDLSRYDLPVLARNFLENGISKNLWYEEVVPHESIFYTIIITPEKECALDAEFERSVIQFGANASIGYGITRISQIASWGGNNNE